MGDIVWLNKITAQEEIFCQWFLKTTDNVFSAYMAGFCSNVKEEIEYSKIDITKKRNLSRAGKIALKKKEVKERIGQIAAEYADKHNKAQLDEVLSFLTAVMRKAKNNNLEGYHDIGQALEAIKVLVKHYPNFEGGAKADSKYVFKRKNEQ